MVQRKFCNPFINSNIEVLKHSPHLHPVSLFILSSVKCVWTKHPWEELMQDCSNCQGLISPPSSSIPANVDWDRKSQIYWCSTLSVCNQVSSAAAETAPSSCKGTWTNTFMCKWHFWGFCAFQNEHVSHNSQPLLPTLPISCHIQLFLLLQHCSLCINIKSRIKRPLTTARTKPNMQINKLFVWLKGQENRFSISKHQ